MSTQKTPASPFADDAALLAFVAAAMRDPRGAAGALAADLESRRPALATSDLYVLLDDWAYAPCDDDLDALCWHSTRENLSDDLRLAMMAIVAGARKLDGTRSPVVLASA